MIPLDQYVGIDMMINPPSLVDFLDGKITEILTIGSSETWTFSNFFHNSRINKN